MVRHERASRGPADERVHRRRLDFEKPVLVEDCACGAHDVAPGTEDIRDGRIGHEIDVALAVAKLDVGQPVPLLGSGR